MNIVRVIPPKQDTSEKIYCGHCKSTRPMYSLISRDIYKGVIFEKKIGVERDYKCWDCGYTYVVFDKD